MTLKKIYNNVLSILLGRGFDLIINFIAVTIIARYLGASQYGIFTSTVALVFILSKIIDIGFAQIVFRETSAKKRDFTYLNNALSIRFILLFFLVSIYNIVAYFINISSIEVLYTNILFLGIIFSAKFQNIRELLEIPFKSELKMTYVMTFNIIDNVALLVLIIGSYLFKLDLLYIVLIYVLANLPGFILFLVFLKRNFDYKYKFQLDKAKWLFTESLPLYGAVILFALFQQLDVILLRNFVSSFEAGIYSAALRLAMPLGIVPLALITTAFPLITRNKDSNFDSVHQTSSIVFKVLFAFSYFAGIFATFKSEEVLILVFGSEYSSASSPMIIIFWASLFIFFSNFIQNFLTIYGEQKRNFIYGLVLVTFNIIFLYLFLISFASIGASIAKIVASGTAFSYLLFSLIRLRLYSNFINLNVIGWTILITIFMYFMQELNLFIFGIITVIFTGSMVFVLRFFTKEEFIILNKMFNNPKWFPKFLLK